MRYEITSQALEQIEAIVIYTDAWFGVEQTDSYLYGLYDSFECLADNPRLGRAWGRDRYRYVYRGHHVYYRIRKCGAVEVPIITNIINSRVRHDI